MMFKKREFADEANNTNEIIGGKEEKAADTRTQELVKQWQRDAEQLKLLVPDFSLESAIKDMAFADALKRGATVFEAYSKLAAAPKKREREEIFQNARSGRRGTGATTLNPAKMTGDDFKKYIDKIKNG